MNECKIEWTVSKLCRLPLQGLGGYIMDFLAHEGMETRINRDGHGHEAQLG